MSLVYHLIALIIFGRTVGTILTRAKAIVAAVTSNAALFPAPTPSIADLNTAILALDQKQTAAAARTKGAAAARDVAWAALKKALNLLRAYVQWISDNAADPIQARAIIEAAGMTVKLFTVRTKAELAAVLGAHSGMVNLFAKAGPKGAKVFFDWQTSPDGKTWSSLPSTVLASTSVENLTPATTVYFRFRRNDVTGANDWSQVVSILVH